MRDVYNSGVDYGTLIAYWNKINSNILLSNSIKRSSLTIQSAEDAKTLSFNLTINARIFFPQKNLRENENVPKTSCYLCTN